MKSKIKIIYLHISDMVLKDKKSKRFFLICAWSSYLCIIKSDKNRFRIWFVLWKEEK